MVIASAGRRIDAPDAKEVRFPESQTDFVAHKILKKLEELKAAALVCSAACGADILALEAARRLGMRRRVVLPFDRARFRETSVVDRPGDWGERYDRLMSEVERYGDAVILGFDPGDPEAYPATNDRILAEASALATSLGIDSAALVIWDGKPRGPSDVTAHFLTNARNAGLLTVEIHTVRSASNTVVHDCA